MPDKRLGLLVVDVQNDFCPGGSLAVANGDKVVDPLNRIAFHFYVKDWPIFYSRDVHPEKTKHFSKFGGKWPVHCVHNTKGAAFHRDLRYDYGHVISKGFSNEDSGHSPFEGVLLRNSSVYLDQALRRFKVTDLYIGGLATDYCVKEACLDAVRLGYTTYLIKDACRAMDPTSEEEALFEMEKAGVTFVNAIQVLRT